MKTYTAKDGSQWATAESKQKSAIQGYYAQYGGTLKLRNKASWAERAKGRSDFIWRWHCPLEQISGPAAALRAQVTG